VRTENCSNLPCVLVPRDHIPFVDAISPSKSQCRLNCVVLEVGHDVIDADQYEVVLVCEVFEDESLSSQEVSSADQDMSVGLVKYISQKPSYRVDYYKPQVALLCNWEESVVDSIDLVLEIRDMLH